MLSQHERRVSKIVDYLFLTLMGIGIFGSMALMFAGFWLSLFGG